MTQTDKDLLLKDLCGRLPYGVKLETLEGPQELDIKWLSINMCNIAHPYLPYLYPLSSMTEEQKEMYCQLQERVIYNSKGPVTEDVMNYVNWCYENNLDINDLISKGLAINATNLGIYENKIIKKG